jgi:hypothetical protein
MGKEGAVLMTAVGSHHGCGRWWTMDDGQWMVDDRQRRENNYEDKDQHTTINY